MSKGANNNSYDQKFHRLKKLLDADLEEILLAARVDASVIDKVLDEKEQHFQKKLNEVVGNHDSLESIKKELGKKVLDIENFLAGKKELAGTDNTKDLKQTIVFLNNILPNKLRNGLFIKEDVARRLLLKLGAKNLERALDAETTMELIDKLGALETLAVTRHTEPEKWQNKFLSELSKSGPEDFEERPIQFSILNTDDFADLFNNTQQPMKPWPLSHNKEAGVINCFTTGGLYNPRTPLLLYTLLYLHYFIETALAAEFLKKNEEHKKIKIGELVVSVIKGHENKLPHFHPNMYSEHLFWERALDLFQDAFGDHDSVRLFCDTNYCGGIVEHDNQPSHISLNLIDLVWDANVASHKAQKDYFNKSETSFLYHFREALWHDIFSHVLGEPRDTFDELVFLHLHKGDSPFTNYMIERKSS